MTWNRFAVSFFALICAFGAQAQTPSAEALRQERLA